MNETLSLAAGWNNLGTLLVAAGYTGRFLISQLTVKNRAGTGDAVTVRRHTSASTAPVTDSGVHLEDGEAYTIGPAGRLMDAKMIWLRNSGAGAIDVDVDGATIG